VAEVDQIGQVTGRIVGKTIVYISIFRHVIDEEEENSKFKISEKKVIIRVALATKA
jgi:hypothetical protein